MRMRLTKLLFGLDGDGIQRSKKNIHLGYSFFSSKRVFYHLKILISDIPTPIVKHENSR